MNRFFRITSFRSTGHRLPAIFTSLIMMLTVRFSCGAATVLLNMGPTIVGESRADIAAKGFNIDIQSWSWGMTRPVLTNATVKRQLSPVSTKDISFSKYLDSSSPGLMNALTKGTIVSEVKLLLRNTGIDRLETFLQLTLKNAVITSYTIDNSSERPTESFTINFTEVTLDYTPFNAAGQPGPKKSFTFNLTAPPLSGAPLVAASVAEVSGPGSDELKTLLHATSEDQLQAREEVRSGTHYLAVEVVRSGSDQTSQLIAQTSNDLRVWSAGTVIEEVVDATTVRYLIPMDQAQQFLRVSTQ
jgi:type VI secretion system secreted protein Hcp